MEKKNTMHKDCKAVPIDFYQHLFKQVKGRKLL